MPAGRLPAALGLLLVMVLLGVCPGQTGKAKEFSDKSPFNQHLPDCTQPYPVLVKNTTEKALICPMFRDEQGFLSEWVGYYQMHGFDHVILYNDESVDGSLSELDPWIKSGFVSVRANWTTETLKINPHFVRDPFKLAMATKALLETDCKLQAIKWGFRYFMSLDIDEYVIPNDATKTTVDALHDVFKSGKTFQLCANKLNFPSTPHLLEPVNLLTIEAYQSRMREVRRMNYYTTVMPKCAYALSGPKHSNASGEFVAKCCHFHGCQQHDYLSGSKFCSSNFKSEWESLGRGGWASVMLINHYSRSLEKYALKAKTWRTATGETKMGEKSADASRNYDLAKFFQRTIGWFHDPTALRYSCQLRALLANVTGEPHYHRPGDQWYRNPEFGRKVGDPDKRGRYGRPSPEGFRWSDGNPYHYHGAWGVER